jgi:hypothetical protein
MRIFPLAISLAIAVVLIGSGGCSTRKTSNTNTATDTAAEKSDAPKDNIEEFQLLVRLPFPPEEVVWKEITLEPSNLPDAATRRMVAVLRFTPDAAARLSEQAGRSRKPTSVELDTETWYPAELIAQGGMNGEGKLAGQSFPADEFLQPPYTQGKLARIENTDYFILELFGR